MTNKSAEIWEDIKESILYRQPKGSFGRKRKEPDLTAEKLICIAFLDGHVDQKTLESKAKNLKLLDSDVKYLVKLKTRMEAEQQEGNSQSNTNTLEARIYLTIPCTDLKNVIEGFQPQNTQVIKQGTDLYLFTNPKYSMIVSIDLANPAMLKVESTVNNAKPVNMASNNQECAEAFAQLVSQANSTQKGLASVKVINDNIGGVGKKVAEANQSIRVVLQDNKVIDPTPVKTHPVVPQGWTKPNREPPPISRGELEVTCKGGALHDVITLLNNQAISENKSMASGADGVHYLEFKGFKMSVDKTGDVLKLSTSLSDNSPVTRDSANKLLTKVSAAVGKENVNFPDDTTRKATEGPRQSRTIRPGGN